MVSEALPSTLPAGHVLMRVAYAGVNASDVNFTAGRYHGSIEAARAAMPLDAGFEAVGAIAAVGQQVTGAALLNLGFVAHNCAFELSCTICSLLICKLSGLLILCRLTVLPDEN